MPQGMPSCHNDVCWCKGSSALGTLELVSFGINL